MTTTNVRPGQCQVDAQQADAGADLNLPDGHRMCDTQTRSAVGDLTSGDQGKCDTHTRSVAGTDVRPGHDLTGTHPGRAGTDLNFPDGHSGRDTHTERAVGDHTSGDQSGFDAHGRCVAGTNLPYVYLSLAAETVDDLERSRIAAENRLRSLHDVYGLPDSVPEVKVAAGMVQGLADLEHQAELNLKRIMRKHPLGPWVARTVGVGEKQGARLLAAVGDPYWNSLHDRPRTVSELWAYSGLHVLPASHQVGDARERPAGGDQPGGTSQGSPDTQSGSAGVAAKRRKGQKANWSTDAKMRAYLIATSCIKQAHSPYRKVYDLRRAHTAETHPDWTPGHSHNDALRIVSKELLKDLWREAKELHPTTVRPSQSRRDTHPPPAGADPSIPGGQTASATHRRAAAGGLTLEGVSP